MIKCTTLKKAVLSLDKGEISDEELVTVYKANLLKVGSEGYGLNRKGVRILALIKAGALKA